MAEEFRFFLRTALYIAVAGVVYWLVSYEASGTVLMATLVIGTVAFVAIGRAFAASNPAREGGGAGLLGIANRWIGFHERPEVAPPLRAGSELVPLSSPWPIVTALGATLLALGLVYGSWLLVPGVVVIAGGCLGWLTQLDPR